MAKSNETILIDACTTGDLSTLQGLLNTNINLSNKSRSKDFNTLFERALFTGLNSKKNNKEVINSICLLAKENLNKLLTDEIILKVANKYKFFVLDIFISHGWSLGNKVSDKNYKTFYDKLFRQSLVYARIELLEYLIPKMNIEWIDLNKLIPFIINNEDIIDLTESKLQSKIEGFSCIYALLCQHGLDPMDISNILAKPN